MEARRIKLGLIGAGIGRSKSPAMHMAEGRAQGLDLSYELIDLDARGVTLGALPALLDEAQAAGFAGVNITHPCKQLVIPLLDGLSKDAAAIGAVNTVVFADGMRQGHNTDWSGFLEAFRRGLPGAVIDTVLQIGAGGAGAAIAHAALKLGVEELLLSDLDGGRAWALAEDLNRRAGRQFAHLLEDVAAAMARADGIINATPVGMAAYPGLPVDPGLIAARHWVAEIVYFPLETALLAASRAKGCRVLDGGGMAVFQAADAFRLFTGIVPDPDRMLLSLRRAIDDEA